MSVASLLSDARAYSSDTVAAATSAMEAATEAVAAVGYQYPSAPSLNLPNPPPQSLSLTTPSLDDVTLVLPAAPTNNPNFQDISPVELANLPVFAATPPTLVPATPPAQLAAFASLAPEVNTSIVFPDVPAALLNPLIDVPVLPNRVEPVKPQTSLPVFDASRPADNTVAPTNLDVTMGNSYSAAAPSMVAAVNGYVDSMLATYNPQYAAQLAKIEAQLTKYLEGGTALNPLVEDAIYSRARAKNNAEARRVRDTAYTEAADRGFTMPTGALMSSMQQARQAGADMNAKAATDIAIAQAEMEQRNLQFAVTTSAGLRTSMLNAALSYMQNLVGINGQALDYAKSILGAIVETYNISLRAFAAKMEVYKADAQVFETRLRSALAGIELYRAEVAALEALTQVDRSKVDVYKARIEGLNALSGVYRAQIEAVQGRAGLERLKLDVFQSQVQAYAAQVQAKNAEWQGFSASLDGETQKVRLYAAQAEAYNAQVQGFKAVTEAKSEVVRAAATTNDSRSRNFAAVWNAYETQVRAVGLIASTKLENERLKVSAFQAEVQAAVGSATVASEYYRSVSQVAVENAKLTLQAQIEGANSTREYGRSIASLGTANAQIYAGLANAAMSGMNTLAAETLQEG